jgi:hypothetical protein
MSETLPMNIAVGDEVRVHFHPPAPWKSFSEGVVRRVDVTTEAGRFFVLEVAHEVILDREHRIRPDFPDYILYEESMRKCGAIRQRHRQINQGVTG